MLTWEGVITHMQLSEAEAPTAVAGSTGWLAAWGVGLRRQPYTDARAPHLPRTHRRKGFYHGSKLNSAFLSKYWRNTEEKDIP